MGKIAIFLAVLVCCIAWWIFTWKFHTFSDRSPLPQEILSQTWTLSSSWSSQVESLKPLKELSREDIVRQKIETIKKRLALKGLIIEWDTYYRWWQHALALKKYLEFYKQNPQDDIINEKIGDTYFSMHKYGSALNYYKKIATQSEGLLLKITYSYFYDSDITDPSQKEFLKDNILSLSLGEQEKFYFLTSLWCLEDFHGCKVDFGEYFTQEIPLQDSWEEKEWWEAEPDIQTREIFFEDLDAIKTAITNYQNFQLDQVYLKNAFIVWAYYQNKLYPLAIHLWEHLLKEKTDYKPVLKIVWQSYFELWEYEKAREIFSQYYEIDDSDPSVAYALWVIQTKLREYVLANIYFQKSLDLGYSNTPDIFRQLIHNYHILENDQNMLQSFLLLIEADIYEQEDLQLAIYYHILHEDYQTALAWSKLGQEVFSDNGNFYAYEWWILRTQWDIDSSKQILSDAKARFEENSFILINLAYTYLEEGNISQALVLFKIIISIAPESEFAVQAEKELETLDNS